MNLPEKTIVIFEENKTRAELYALWLDDYDSRIATSKQAAQDQIRDGLAVAVVDEGFGDGAAQTLVEIINTEARPCQIVVIRERSADYPDIDAAQYFTKPVFEEQLKDDIGRLLYRHNYHRTLQLYHESIRKLAARGWTDDEPEQVAELREQVTTLRSRLGQYREQLSDNDVAAVRQALTVEQGEPGQQAVRSKYQPDHCPGCNERLESEEATASVERIAAYVWRCTECGEVLIENDPGRSGTHIYMR